MGKGQHVVLITRRIGLGDEDEAEIVIGVRVGDQELQLPMDTKVQVEYDAGQSLGLVTMTLYADTVRHEREPEKVTDPEVLAITQDCPAGPGADRCTGHG